MHRVIFSKTFQEHWHLAHKTQLTSVWSNSFEHHSRCRAAKEAPSPRLLGGKSPTTSQAATFSPYVSNSCAGAKERCSYQLISLGIKDSTWEDLVSLLSHSSYGLQAEKSTVTPRPGLIHLLSTRVLSAQQRQGMLR